ncbi:hypothetical protein [Mycolicibacter algericus]|uniref:Outer membrane protein n=2 Tax=Mycolicibacter algericus TaxID=1288388 RepID=A0A7I9YGY5_MYCAL|nr:hypothetical protein [Mycolicibacter algericus]OQZ92585.1 hypothetical protein BST10_21055 [Mycolicibacter algericus DSM 45454]GFG85623.1 hypothetical protein MALGJ_22990 [Mycolicibacter algericus]GFG87940.1 hypothetical protein MALGJ_46160 [Mycolicibacter algericus]
MVSTTRDTGPTDDSTTHVEEQANLDNNPTAVDKGRQESPPSCPIVNNTTTTNSAGTQQHRIRVAILSLLPALTLLFTLAAAFGRWQTTYAHETKSATIQSVQAARDAATALLSYRFDTVGKQLDDARDRLTGSFLDSYTSLTRDVVVPAAQQRHITAEATVPAVASVSTSVGHAVVLVFVNQYVTVDNGAPTQTNSAVRVTLEKVSGRWLISGFDPV